MKRIASLLVALVVLSGAIFSPNEAKADVVRLACEHMIRKKGESIYFTIWLKKEWSSYKYIYSEAHPDAGSTTHHRRGLKQLVEKTGSVEDHGHKLNLLGLEWGGYGATIEKQEFARSKHKVPVYTFLGYPNFECQSFGVRPP